MTHCIHAPLGEVSTRRPARRFRDALRPMSDPARVEALVLAELEATGKSKLGGRAKGSGGKSAHETNGVADGAIGSPRVPKPTGMYKVSRAVQRAAPSTMSTVSVDEDDADGLRRAAVHHWRARMMVKLSSLYSDAAWEAQEKPRKFFIKHRGFGPSHGKNDLPSHRRMFLRCALASAERASELAPTSAECVTLTASILNLANAEDGAGVADAALKRACAACRDAVQLHEWWSDDLQRGAFEVAILHSPGAAAAAAAAASDEQNLRNADEMSKNVADAPLGGCGSPAKRVESLKAMALYAARILAERRREWDDETQWVKESGDGLSGVENSLDTAEDTLAAVDLGADNEDDENTSDTGWNMWQSPSILDYSLAALHGHR